MSPSPLVLALVLGYLLDLALGDPQGWPHPIRWLGRLIAWWEKRLYAPGLAAGSLFWLACLASVGLVLAALLGLLALLPLGLQVILGGLVIWSCLATRSLHEETRLAEKALAQGDLVGARLWLGRVVSRQTDSLDQTQVRRALLETIGENLSDGVLAPLFWCLVAGLPGLALYKTINTLDSMVGYRNRRYLLFGRLAARADDLANYLPARLCALLMVGLAPLLGLDLRKAARVLARDHARAASPNAGWPEAALAGALDVRLGGPSQYFGQMVDKPFINPAGSPPGPGHWPGAVRMLYGVSLAGFLQAVLALQAAGAGWGGWIMSWWGL